MNNMYWMGIKIESNLPEKLLIRAMNLLQEDSLVELEKWHRVELHKQNKKELKSEHRAKKIRA